MPDQDAIINCIIDAVQQAGVAQVPGYVAFKFVCLSGTTVVLRRRNGKTVRIPLSTLRIAVSAVVEDPTVYSGGPSRLREFGITHINSPTWALLHMLPLVSFTAEPSSATRTTMLPTNEPSQAPPRQHSKELPFPIEPTNMRPGTDKNQPLEERYPDEFRAFQALFGSSVVKAKIDRINEIHSFTEGKWSEYVSGLPGGQVRFLLIAEAPPWSEEGQPQYLLDQQSSPRTLMKALGVVFLKSAGVKAQGPEALNHLASQGFLLVDSLPFSMDYSAKRPHIWYRHLVRRAANGYLQTKLRSSLLSWSPDVRIAFSVRSNAVAVIEALGAEICLGARTVPLNMDLVAINDAGYPDAAKLASVFGLRY